MLPELKQYADLAYANHDTIQNTYDCAMAAINKGIEGVFVECGVAAGSQIGVMGHVCRLTGDKRKIYAYDSYEGIPLAGPNDTEQPGVGPLPNNHQFPPNLLVSSGITVHNLPAVQHNIGKRWGLDINQYVFVKGWFQNTVPINNIDKIALLRLDGDLYDSTRVCLEYLHPKVQRGGYVIIDDYALSGARKAVTEYFEKHKLICSITPVDRNKPEVHWYEVL